MHQYFTCCGLYCGACSSMLTLERNQGAPDAAHFVCDYEESPCPGCKGGETQDCEFIRCCQEHDVSCCAYCNDFPCEMLKRFSVDEWVHHRDVIANHTRIKEIGIEAWLLEQSKQWTCPSCGARTHWYKTSCPLCKTEWQARYES